VKGKGFAPAEADQVKWHAAAHFDKETGAPLKPSAAGALPRWQNVFGQALTDLADERKDVVAITAAMSTGTGTDIFEKKHPERFFDVGIAEAHAVTFAAGLATQGIRRWRPSTPPSCSARTTPSCTTWPSRGSPSPS
jgi:1-deoxy-D-xylulose-5-phosphate synthase